MVLKTTLCRFSGLRIWPGRGMLYIRTDNQQFLFLNKKCKRMYHNRLRPAKLAWTTTYRKAHKKDQVAEVARKKRRNTNKATARAIVGVSLEVINKKRTEKPEVRQSNREKAIREVKERAKKAKAEKAKAATKASAGKAAPAPKAPGERRDLKNLPDMLARGLARPAARLRALQPPLPAALLRCHARPPSAAPPPPTTPAELPSLAELLGEHGARLTTAAQMVWASVLRPGDLAIDATCGNGNDTLFLASAVGPRGAVVGVDVQAAAVDATRALLADRLPPGGAPRVDLHVACHSQLQALVGSNVARVVAFNLGYLPRGADKTVATRRETTLAAVEAALEVVVPGGLVSIMAYVGHPGGLEEYEQPSRALDMAPTQASGQELLKGMLGRLGPASGPASARAGSRPAARAPSAPSEAGARRAPPADAVDAYDLTHGAFWLMVDLAPN
ncbi:RPL24B [Scenedesmus sp. PABB004]|nr:RPL24B [Scenedesmus sp. PABB004]